MIKPKEKAAELIKSIIEHHSIINVTLTLNDIEYLALEKVKAIKVVLYEVSIIEDKTVNKTIQYYNEVINEIKNYFHEKKA